MLLGRSGELSEIRRLLGGAREGRSGVLALVGEPGIGKSSLLEEAARLAEGMLVLRARGVQSEAQIPFAGLLELLRPALGCLDRIPEPQAEALESALALRPARSADRYAVGAATLSLLAAYAETLPLAVLVDDAHWLDGSAADALLFAARRLVADPIAVLLGVREGEPSLLDGADLPVLRLEGLDRESAAALLPDATPQLAERLHRETGGNPLALLELGREGLEPTPLDAPVSVLTSVSEAYLQRARALADETRDALVLAAATDRGDLALYLRAGGDVAALEPAAAAGLVALRVDRVEFRHPLARSALYAAGPPETRRRVHRALSAALPDADADRRAWHLALAATGPDDVALSALEQAGVRARERSAYDVASRAFERAAQLAAADEQRGRLLAAAADTAWLGGLGERAVSLLDTAERHLPSAELAHLRGHVLMRRGPLTEARDVLLPAVERDDPPPSATLLAEATFGGFWAADAAWLRACAERARELAGLSTDDHTAFLTAIAAGVAGIFFGDPRAGDALRAAAMLHERTPELRHDPRLLVFAVVAPLWLRESDFGHEIVDGALATARKASAVGVLPQMLVHVAIEQAATDRWVEAEAAFDEAIALAEETGQRFVLAAALSRLALLEARLGRQASSRAHVEAALQLARELGAGQIEIWALCTIAELELVRGDVGAALARYEEQAELLGRLGSGDVDLSPAPEQVELLLRAGRERDAVDVAAGYAAAADAKGQPWARARAARSRGLLASEDTFSERFEDALELHASTPDVFETARTELAYGSRLRRAGRRTAAREHLRTAVDIFDRLGAAPWAERATAELAATGETARRRDPSTRDQLTPQELQVSLLLAEGRTTKEAAAALFLSPKTIEYHLRNTYRKLDVHSRDELREALRVQRVLARD